MPREYIHDSGRREGGIRRIALVRAAAIERAVYDPVAKAWREVRLLTGEAFVNLGLPADGASMIEKLTQERGLTAVSHTLTIPLEGLRPQENLALSALLSASPAGVVAMVETRDGQLYLIGYSTVFAAESALRIAAADGTTGRGFSDIPGRVITLRAVDNLFSQPYVGDPQTIFD